ncbi:hypothetical protein [Bacillus toyonensis]|uniref:hypothetical protein n=1 Tax=Bacillus toyonensis TaxID=155322 RepID=UPI000BF0B1FB|nr:hypothetical protein [Bacillus toyonensis]PEK83403.1 hypothetical protein CN594_20560 [Bacillus toyonensis]PEO49297.1 hypothetical protein CN579_29325 [Bacillus toyonensis]PFY35757.1 hypothetical protein COL55_30575 [Bacillus toyonensis]PFY43888.1 hypothetical protein COL54_12705 [Bacillus toyonensis]PFY78179.1 hypothetical protein COL62_21215 [Bacillus toyonensis]
MINDVIEKEWIENFIKTDEFSEALGIVWRFGHIHESNKIFELSHKSQNIISRFFELIADAAHPKSRYRKEKGFTEWYCSLNMNHPFIDIIKSMGWTPRLKQERLYPKGTFNETTFVKTYILMRHDVGIMRENSKGKILIRPRLRIHGSIDVLNNICRVLHQDLGIPPKKLQTDLKVERAKTIYYQSKKDIPAILNYIGAKESLEKFNSFNLGYQEVINPLNQI